MHILYMFTHAAESTAYLADISNYDVPRRVILLILLLPFPPV
jgi:hypothetical protein